MGTLITKFIITLKTIFYLILKSFPTGNGLYFISYPRRLPGATIDLPYRQKKALPHRKDIEPMVLE